MQELKILACYISFSYFFLFPRWVVECTSFSSCVSLRYLFTTILCIRRTNSIINSIPKQRQLNGWVLYYSERVPHTLVLLNSIIKNNKKRLFIWILFLLTIISRLILARNYRCRNECGVPKVRISSLLVLVRLYFDTSFHSNCMANSCINWWARWMSCFASW